MAMQIKLIVVDNPARYKLNPKVRKMFLEISFPFDFLLEIPEFSVEWFAFRKFDNFRQGTSVPFVPVLKIWN